MPEFLFLSSLALSPSVTFDAESAAHLFLILWLDVAPLVTWRPLPEAKAFDELPHSLLGLFALDRVTHLPAWAEEGKVCVELADWADEGDSNVWTELADWVDEGDPDVWTELADWVDEGDVWTEQVDLMDEGNVSADRADWTDTDDADANIWAGESHAAASTTFCLLRCDAQSMSLSTISNAPDRLQAL